jgi:heterodisulfide reductase subunit A-like polyferredoxin
MTAPKQTQPTGKCPGCQRRVKRIPWGAVISLDEHNDVFCWQCTHCGSITEFIMGEWKIKGRDVIKLAPMGLAESVR